MCGIVGSVQVGGLEPDRDRVRRAMDQMAHRGPDGQGFKEFAVSNHTADSLAGERLPATVLLGHRRLAIIDLSDAASQPMSTPDGRFHLIFNGEIYNYREIGTELKNLGLTLRTSSDAEVLLLAWQRWGTDLLPRLIGMFSFAILDRENATVVLARDPFGIKPLYYAQDQKRLVFASEIAPVLDFQGITRRANLHAVYEFLSGGFGDHSGRTFFDDIHQLPAAHYLSVSCESPGTAVPVRYWDLQRQPADRISPEEASSRFRDLFEESIKLHLRSDVPVGVSLSGGTDSSSITAVVRAVQGPQSPLHTFSYVADDPQLSEERWSTIVARATSAQQHLVHVEPGELVQDFQRLAQVQEQPFGSPTIYAQYRIFRCAHEAGLKVMLSGQGADQYLGYIRHLSVRLASLLRQGRWGAAIRFVSHVRALSLNGALSLRSVVRHTLPESLVARIRRSRNATPLGANVDWFRQRGVGLTRTHDDGNHCRLHDLMKQSLLETLPSLLRFEDRNAMTFSVENRVPFLTSDLVNFVFSLPEEEVISGQGRCKAVLLRAMQGIVPSEILERRDKIGFAMPLSKLNRQTYTWLEGALREAADIPALNAAELQRQSRLTLCGEASDTESQRRLWRWLSLITWAREFQVSFE
jgi:asparagine synthase (glutamine-hydrolysing)